MDMESMNPTTDECNSFSDENLAAAEARPDAAPRPKMPVDPATGAELPLVLHRGGYLWFLRPDGTYSQKVNSMQEHFRGTAFKQHLKWAVSRKAVELTVTDKKGEEKEKSKGKLIDDYAHMIEGGIGLSLSATANTFSFDGESLVEALCPLRPITPRRDPQIEKWLELIGGDRHAQLLDWVATITMLDRPSSILLIAGEPGIGKGMILEGLARLWGTSYTRLYDFVGRFNGSISHSPLVGVDEGSDNKDRTVDTKTLRSVSAQSQFMIERKGQEQVPADGCVRIVITCNDFADVLRFNEDLNASSRDAVQNRFLVIRPNSAGAIEYLRQIGGRATTDRWVRGDALAAHALWLRDTRKVTPGARFAVEAVEDDEFRSFISLSSNASVALASWLIKYLTHPELLDIKPDWIQVRDGKLWVYPDLFDSQNAWETFCKVKHPGPQTVRKSLEVLGVKSAEEYRPWITSAANGITKKIHPRFKQIDTGMLFQQARTLGVGDVDAMRATLDGAAPPAEEGDASAPF